MKKSLSRHPILAGTLILSAANIVTKIIGFFYRVYLSRVFGAEGMGIIQLTGPLCAMVFAMTGAGMQTAISKCVSAVSDADSKKRHQFLCYGAVFSLTLSFLCTFLVYRYADFLALHFLSEPRTAPLLRMLALSFPLSALHACINGYFLGKHRTLLPAISQFVEQLARVSVVYICCNSFFATSDTPQLTFLAWGTFFGEAAALCVIFLARLAGHGKGSLGHHFVAHPANRNNRILRSLLEMSVPLSANRLAVHFLQSIESIRLPLMLEIYGLSDRDALSTYGILTGMALPVLFFPGAFTGALSAMLIPAISEAHSKQDKERIKTITLQATFLVVFSGLFFGILFFMFSDFLGNTVFKEPLAAVYIRSLCLLCPFMYINGVFTGILQGLGKAVKICFINVSALCLRLLFIFFAVPQYGIRGYLTGLLLSQLYSSGMYLYSCYHIHHKTD